MSDKPCPHPEKVRYTTRAEAKKRKNKHRQTGDHVRPYQCACGWWHLGHLPTETRLGFRSADQVYGRSA